MKKMTLKKRLFLILFLLFSVEMIILQLSFRRSYQKYDELVYEKDIQVMTLYADQIEKEIDKLENASLSVIGDDEIQNSLSVLRFYDPSKSSWVTARRNIKQSVSHLLHFNNYIHTLMILTPNETFTASINPGDMPLQDKETYWNLACSQEGKPVWIAEPGRQGSLILIREIREIQDRSMSTLGVVVAQICLDELIADADKVLQEMGMPLNVSIYLGNTAAYLGDKRLKNVTMEDRNWSVEKVNGQKVFCASFYSPKRNWRYIVTTDFGKVSSSVAGANMLTLVTALISVTVVCFICLFLVNAIVKHFTILQQKFDMYAQNKIPEATPVEKVPYSDEISSLYRHFDQMIYDHHVMSQEICEKQKLLFDAQIKQLKQQIQPHFLFNTLETINFLSMCGKNDEVSVITQTLGKMLRTTLKEQRNLVTIKEEIGFAENYLTIQEIRYGDRLQVEADVEPGTENVLIPCMTIQPLVENSIKHALEVTIETCRIGIHVRTEGDEVKVSIEDNGPGINEDVLEEIKQGRHKTNGLGIGLCNIDKRLRLLISEKNGLQFHTDESGTCVTFRLRKDEYAQSIARG